MARMLKKTGGIIRYFRIDPEANRLLDLLAPSPGKRGSFVSHLILQAYRERQLRRQIARQIVEATDED